jgi:Protein of unknown function (DUF1064)
MRATKFQKYRNQPTVIEGQRFASKREASRFLNLKLMLQAGKIRHLQCQVRFNLIVNNMLICVYVADFTYDESHNGQWRPIVEDVKGVRTDTYKLKRKLMQAVHGIEIHET